MTIALAVLSSVLAAVSFFRAVIVPVAALVANRLRRFLEAERSAERGRTTGPSSTALKR